MTTVAEEAEVDRQPSAEPRTLGRHRLSIRLPGGSSWLERGFVVFTILLMTVLFPDYVGWIVSSGIIGVYLPYAMRRWHLVMNTGSESMTIRFYLSGFVPVHSRKVGIQAFSGVRWGFTEGDVSHAPVAFGAALIVFGFFWGVTAFNDARPGALNVHDFLLPGGHYFAATVLVSIGTMLVAVRSIFAVVGAGDRYTLSLSGAKGREDLLVCICRSETPIRKLSQQICAVTGLKQVV